MKRAILVAAAMVFSSVLAASATTVTVTGSAVELSPVPLNVTNGAPGDNNNILWFQEASNVLVTADQAGLGGTSISTGQRVDSYMIFLNRADSSNTLLNATATFEFSTQVLGIFGNERTSSGNDLDATDYLASMTIYTDFNSRGIENNNDGSLVAPLRAGGAPNDEITFDGASKVELTFYVTQPGDWVRVVTVTAVPLPAALPLMLVGLGGLAFVARRRSA